jgi:ssDNA-binding Zn-finger/Zn-ribbon topoisomerase 1
MKIEEKIVFGCSKCGGELDVRQIGYKRIIEQDPYTIGTRTRRKAVFEATCKNCGKVDKDYFKLF